MKKKVLVYGWYNHGNIGDSLFQEAYRHLFSDYDFTFTDQLTSEMLLNYDALFLGGGSFLDQAASIRITDRITIPVFYIGIGAETNIHPIHQQLLQIATLIILRSADGLEKIKAFNSNVIVASDLIYSLPQPASFDPPPEKTLLFLPNIALLSQHYQPYWKHRAWEWGKVEIAQFLDDLIDEGYFIRFFPMCANNQENDNWAATEIMGKMKNRSASYLLEERPEKFEDILELFAGFDKVITQRFHGKVLSDMANRPCLTLSHHDKLSGLDPNALSFYGLNKKELKKRFDETKTAAALPINSHSYKDIAKKINDILI